MNNIRLFRCFICLCFFSSYVLYGCGEKKPSVENLKKEVEKTTETLDTVTKKAIDTLKSKVDTIKTKIDTLMTKEGGNIVVLETSMGDIKIELYEKDAPQHTANFKKLVKSKFYEGTTFHRVIPGFMIQGGDPNSKDDDRSNDGQGGPGYTIPAEIKAKHKKGAVAGARLGDAQNPKRESSGSQFYIVTGEASHLDGQYTVFGEVIKGMDVAEKIQNVKRDSRDNPIEKVVIKKVYFEK
ncbi:MAG: peptidylprolyl isomerase [Ignavibacteria bacterium]